MTNSRRPGRRFALHAMRVLLFTWVVVLIHWQHAARSRHDPHMPTAPVSIDILRKHFPDASDVAPPHNAWGEQTVRDRAGNRLGGVVQTSPQCDQVIGFSGPTNTLILFDTQERIAGIEVLSSGDTRDHVDAVTSSDNFMTALNGLTVDEARNRSHVDAVSGATLTSAAISESIARRLGGDPLSTRFPDPVVASDLQRLFPTAHSVEQDASFPSRWWVRDAQRKPVGSILRTSPHADQLVGYQGPTDTLIAFNSSGRICGLALRKSFDNELYVQYVRDDKYFLTAFNDLVLEELARLDRDRAGVEGVSGATMTSQAVTDGMILAAEQHRVASENAQKAAKLKQRSIRRLIGTSAVILFGYLIAWTSLRRRKALRFVLQVAVIVLLGLINGDLVSQAMLVGWAQHGIPWRGATSLLVLAAVALVTPVVTGRNVYCSHLCPHGAAQQLLKRRGHRISLPTRWANAWKWIRPALLLWVVIVAMTSLSFSLVDIEPFDAWVFRVAGWASLAIAIVGLVLSRFVPMAYCRFGCPTGSLLNFLRLNGRSDHWNQRDWFALALAAVATLLWLSA